MADSSRQPPVQIHVVYSHRRPRLTVGFLTGFIFSGAVEVIILWLFSHHFILLQINSLVTSSGHIIKLLTCCILSLFVSWLLLSIKSDRWLTCTKLCALAIFCTHISERYDLFLTHQAGIKAAGWSLVLRTNFSDIPSAFTTCSVQAIQGPMRFGLAVIVTHSMVKRGRELMHRLFWNDQNRYNAFQRAQSHANSIEYIYTQFSSVSSRQNSQNI